ncbi:vacuolar membrane-associated protein iml1 [Coemansia sp. RSA 2711]|nr:vacuolar membrane-associated protein iml1 [Coemansia sp. RSA 2711]
MRSGRQAYGHRNHVSIFDRRGQKPGRGRTPGKGNNGVYTPGAGHRHDDQAGPTLFNKLCMLRVHEEAFSTQDLVLNPAFFPGIRIGDIVAIKPILEGDDGELASPRNSLDNDTPSSAAAAASNGSTTHAGDSSSSKGKGSSSAVVGSTANGGTTTETDDKTDTASTNTAGADKAGNRSNRRPDMARRDSVQGRSARTHGPRRPSRWVGMAESDGAGHGVDDEEGGLRADPHREILLQVGEVRRDTQQIQASVSNHVARTLWGEYATNQRVAVRKIDLGNAQERELIRADFVEIAFRDQYVGRSDMWRLWRNLAHKVVHNNKVANMEGLIRASVRRIYKDGVDIPCGFIDGSTQPIFRSESGRFIIFIQMSEEMWAYQEDGHLCFEKTVNSFLAELFRRWSEKQLNHMVTIVMFSRWYYHQRDSLFFPDLIYDEDHGRYYRDYYKVVADMEVRTDWSVFLPEILAEFNTYRRDIQELRTPAGMRLRGDLSKAHQGNILEAINLGINSYSSTYVDRDLSRTGLSTIVVTPSFGVFDVPKRLLRMTTERMLHLGIRVDFVCLAPRPLFRPPVFRFKSYPVPTEQEQRRALSRIAQADQGTKATKGPEINSVSPLAESPGPHGNVPFAGLPASKERGPKTIPVSKSEYSFALDPLMLDPLYFDEEHWVNEVLPMLTGAAPRNPNYQPRGFGFDPISDPGPAPPPPSATTTSSRGSELSASIISSLIGGRREIDPAEIPETIRELHAEQFPYFAALQQPPQPDDRVTYYYFAYWVDSGFYNYTDQSATHHPGDFAPTCKMGELSVTGIASYMRRQPMVPDLDLARAVTVAEADYAASAHDMYTGSGTDSPIEALRARSAECRSIEAQMVAMARDVSHGRILRSDRLSSVPGHERLHEMFAAFDRQAISSSNTQSPPEGMGHPGSILESSRYALGHIPTPLHLSQHSTAIVPSNASAHWEEHSGYHIARASEPRATERTDASSVERAELLPAASSSASPNLRHNQPIKPPARSEHSLSSSMPRETKLGHNHPGAVVQRTSIFARNNAPPKRPQPKQASEPLRSNEPSFEHQRHSIAGPMYDARGRGSTPDAGTRQGNRMSNSPQSIEYSRDSLGTIDRSGSGILSIHGASSGGERLAVSESIARQSHLEDHIRTFRSASSHENSAQQQQQQQHASHHTQSPPSAAAPSSSGQRYYTHDDFQLTLPPGRQLAMPFSATTAPSQPSAPLAPEYHSGSPQHAKAMWLERLAAHGPDTVAARALRGRGYGPYNPSNPELYPLPHTELSQRWAFAFATRASLSSYTPKWRSLCTPASLPLVTDYYPTNLDSLVYQHYFYHIKTPDITAEEFVDLPQEDYDEFAQFMATRTQSSAGLAAQTDVMRRTDRSTFIMLKEMVYQRLAQNFQFINMGSATGPRSRTGARAAFGAAWPKHSEYASGSPHSSMLTAGALHKSERAIWLSNGRQVQRLDFHEINSTSYMPGVGVTRWRRNTPFDPADLSYRFQMWSRNNSMGYSAADTRFSYPQDEEVNWNTLDYLITGYQSNLTRSMKYWRTRYVLIPMDQLGNDTIVNTKSSPHMSMEDLRIANFEKFLDHILRLLGKDEKNRLEDRFLGALPPELRRSTYAFGAQHEARRATHHRPNTSSQPPQPQPQSTSLSSQPGAQLPQLQQQQSQQQQQFPAPPPQLTHAVSMHDTRKAIGLSDMMPSSLMQIRYTTMYPVPYTVNQLNSYMADSVYLNPSTPIPLPPPAASALGLPDGLNVESPFAQLAQALLHATAGISLRNIRWHFGYFASVFVGYQLVDWILVNFDSVSRRSQAVAAGNRLMERGVFRSPHRPGAFLDGYYFYEFSEATLRSRAGGGNGGGSGGQGRGSLMSIGFADMVSRYGPGGSNNASPSASRPQSRQGSTAPSLTNDEPAANTSGGTTPKPGEKKQGSRTNSLRELPGDPSRQRVRSDVAVDSPVGSTRADDSGAGGLPGRQCDSTCQRTADMLSAQQSRRPLPKALQQSRAFALDLDQQHKSTRIERCLVHLDAVHNPATCFHLSVNWLNCTNHLIDELVRGWARMAERCGMRLVEAPRAQDSSVEDSHPFHSPIHITLEAPPPHASRIFDDAWIAEFAFFGEDESSESEDLDSGSDGDAERDPATRRVLRRMAQCIPSYPFERELLEEQDFVLDVEAEANYPAAARVAREYTYDRVGHRFTQYVHRSGTAFVQICGPGQFLWLNNYLYTSHQNHVRPPPQSQPSATSLAGGTGAGGAGAGGGGSGASQMSLGTYARSDGGSAAHASDVSAVSTPLGSRSLGRLAHGASSSGRAAAAAAAAAAMAEAEVLPGAGTAVRSAPVYYPMRQSREMWPHQVLSSLARHRTPERKLYIPAEYSMQIVDELGRVPADFDSVNAAVTRVAVMRDAAGGALADERVPQAHASFGEAHDLFAGPQDAGPDALRANFIEICKDKNSLEMFWQQTVQRYRDAWRDLKSPAVPAAGDPQRNKPMVVDMLSEAMWQPRRHLPPTA